MLLPHNFDQPSLLLDCLTRFAIQPRRKSGKNGAYRDRIILRNLKQQLQKNEFHHVIGENPAGTRSLGSREVFFHSFTSQLPRWACCPKKKKETRQKYGKDNLWDQYPFWDKYPDPVSRAHRITNLNGCRHAESSWCYSTTSRADKQFATKTSSSQLSWNSLQRI